MDACPADDEVRRKRSSGCRDNGLLLAAVQEYALAADRALVRLFDFGPYADIAMDGKVNVPALAALAPLLGPLLRAAPQGVVNQADLAVVILQIMTARDGDLPSGKIEAELAAGRARTALSHLRRLCKQPNLRAQRSKTASPLELAALQSLADTYQLGCKLRRRSECDSSVSLHSASPQSFETACPPSPPALSPSLPSGASLQPAWPP